jgi:predicted DNA-binding protein with PD1-like motif
MKKLILLLFFILSIAGYSQEKIPDVYSITSQFERIEIIRMRTDTDLLEGLKKVAAEKNIKNAVILSGIGSVTDYHYHVVSDKNLPPAEEDPSASVAMDLIAVQGYIFNGRIHAHISLSDENSVVGGHLEPGTKALTFFIITLGVLPDALEIENFDNYKL